MNRRRPAPLSAVNRQRLEALDIGVQRTDMLTRPEKSVTHHDALWTRVIFEFAVLLATASAYVLVELALLVVANTKRREARVRALASRLQIEAYRPVTSWTAPPE
jgi:hypothetical protein